MSIIIKKGLSINLAGSPSQTEIHSKTTAKVAVNAADFVGLKPRVLVQVGDVVKAGEGLFIDKQQPEVLYTAPVAGKIIEIERGEKRALQHIVIEQDGTGSCVEFKKYSDDELSELNKEIVEQLIKSGAWTYFLSRPFGHVAKLINRPDQFL